MNPITTFLISLTIASTLSAQISYYTASLTGAQEVPARGSTAIGKGCLTLNGTTLTVTVNTTTFQTTPTAGHIHQAAAGVNGGVIIPFTQNSPTNWTATATLTAAQLTALQNGGLYCNIHTTAFANGEIRGQIGPATLPTHYGVGCPGSNRSTPAIGNGDFPCIGMPFTFTLANARPTTMAGLLIGTSNTSFNSLTLPFALDAIGMPGCSLLTSDLGLGLTSTTDAAGATLIAVPIPLDLALVNLQLYAQWYSVDQGANSLGVVVSNGLAFLLQ